MSVPFIDIFCGAGGSSLGLTAAGMELKLAANHWDVAINTHAANFPDAEHLCADVNNYDMRRLPKAPVLWASPICTESTPAGGKRKKRGNARHEQMAFLTEEEQEERRRAMNKGWERTRATAYDVIRATEVWGYDVVLIENVLEFITDWPLFWWWIEGMGKLGYDHQIVSVNSAHIGGDGNPHAPQWRDRIYITFVRKGIRLPDLEPRPWAYCFDCSADVQARQTWKTHTPLGAQRLGKYREQYTYTCPHTSRRHDNPVLEPYVLPAAAAIDWSDLGERIGDRKRPLVPNTMARIREGLRMVTEEPVVIQVNHAGHDGRAYPAGYAPLACRTVRGGDGFAISPLLVPVGGSWNTTATTTGEPMRTRMANPKGIEALICPPLAAEPFIVEAYGTSTARPAAHPMAAVTAGGNHHFLVSPFAIKNYGGNCQPEHTVVRLEGPLSTITGRDHHSLVVPYRRGSAKTSGQPLHTLATKDSASLVRPDSIDIDDCRFRMLKAREHLRGQRFPDSYTVTGNQQDQTMQAGNAVSSNVAQWIGQAVMEVLG